MEYKTTPVEFKADGDKGEYDGHFAVFNNVDDGGDVAHPGMFLKTIQERANRVKVFYMHEWDKLLGPAPDVLEEDAIGLHAKGRLTLDSWWAGQVVWPLMKDGALSEGSFGYETVKADWGNNADGGTNTVRHLREVKLYEISPVPLGMNPLTQLRAVKAFLTGKPAAEVVGETLGKQGEAVAVETYFETLEAIASELKVGRVLSAANVEKARSALSALQAALESLQQLISAAEPEPDKLHSALRQRVRAARAALSLYN